ncbi:hypothetical protein WR25_15213 [Diploscapter pachys]|uniref:Uncharacterized protein n=1 Tax=Diploscapter pachys TaxID=2018661 RepID=A0A2A2LUH9_9BILA|nr:hypothetical protein WR25_15213 [Diploscapter pachys]
MSKKPNQEEIDVEQAERREYVKNIGIEYRYGCYEEKRADSCQLLAEYMETFELNSKGAFALYKKNCEERKWPRSCYKLAMYILAGKEAEPNLKAMVEPLKIACDANIAQGCRFLSLVHWNGEKDRPVDSQKAEQFMKKACDLEDGDACWLLSTWYMGNKEKFKTTAMGAPKEISRDGLGTLERDMMKSLEYGRRACEFHIPQSCINVARMYKLGDGVPKNLDEAHKYAEKAKEYIEALKSGDHRPDFTG